MTSETLSSLTGDIVLTSARTARHLVQAAQRGGERIVGRIDAKWESGVVRRAARLSPKLRSDLVKAEREITGLCARGVATLSRAAQGALAGASRVAVAQVDRVSATAARFEPIVGSATAQSLRVVAMPSVRALSDLAEGAAGRMTRLADRVLGPVEAAPVRAKTAASRKSTRRVR